MLRFKWGTNVFVCQLQRRARIAVFWSSWHMGHPPKAMTCIPCGVLPFRSWHAFCGPLVRLSCHHSGVSLLSSIPSASPSLLLLISSTRLPGAALSWFRSTLPSPFVTPIPSLCSCLYPSPSLPPCTVVFRDGRARECRSTLQCHDPETSH